MLSVSHAWALTSIMQAVELETTQQNAFIM